jgi:hypothetical protein
MIYLFTPKLSSMFNQANISSMALDHYDIQLSSGSYFQFDHYSPPMPYDFKIHHHFFVEDKQLQIGFKRGNTTTFRYTDKTRFFVNVNTYFTENLGAGNHPLIRISGSRYGIMLDVFNFQDSKWFGYYVDILRNESPLFMDAFCQINDAKSKYHELNSMDLLPISEIDIEGSGTVNITSLDEPVGEGEIQKDVFEALIKQRKKEVSVS